MLKLERLVCGYGRRRITKEITMELDGVTLIYGPNGVGKSTFLKTLAGIIRPISGRVIIEAERKDVFYLSEKIDVPEGITAKEYCLVFVALYGANRRKSLRRMEEALEVLGITHLADSNLSQLSQGQRRMVQLSIPFALQRKVNLLDDPLVGIDRKAIRIKELIDGIAENGVVVITDRSEDFWNFVPERVDFSKFSAF